MEFILLKPHAYLDPGSGSLLLQILLGTLLGAGFIIKMFWKRITGIFSRSSNSNPETIDDIE
jgi:hypothetical protein